MALLEADDVAAASQLLTELLALNPNDNQGVRYVLLRVFAEAGNYAACKKLFAQYQDEFSIEFAATKLLIGLSGKLGDKQLSAIVADVDEANQHLLPALRKATVGGKWPGGSRSDYCLAGSKEVANNYLASFKLAWQRKPQILDRLSTLQPYSKISPARPLS